MSLDSKIWENTLPGLRKKNESENYNVSNEKWINTIASKKTNNKLRIYSITTTFFILGLILISITKNETRGLQKEIDKLRLRSIYMPIAGVGGFILFMTMMIII